MIKNNKEMNARISSLDQLFAQAHCLHPLLICKVREWARTTGGCVKIRRGETCTYERYSELGINELAHIEWCKVKTLQRAIEKAVRAYGQVRHCV